MVKIILNENQINNLFEYHAQQRLPFDDDFYGKKNQAEHYLDWLEEFGKYGKIGNSSLSLQDCVENGVKMAIEKKRISVGYYEYYTDYNDLVETEVVRISNDLMGKFKYMIYDSRNNIYVERVIKISDSIDSVVNDLFSSLTNKYENNVGGCWAFKRGMGYAYCSNDSGSQLLLKGWIRLEDVDWLKTCDLNYNHDEFEIRVKPNAKVELFEVIADGRYKLPLHDTLVVSSTYFGNNSTYNGNLATIDDGMGHKTLINRKGERINYGDIISYNHLFDDLYSIKNKLGEYTIIDSEGNRIINGYYDGIEILGDYICVEKKYLYSLVDRNGNFLIKEKYNNIEPFNGSNLFTVELNNEYNLYDISKGGLLYDEWFKYIDDIHFGFARVENKFYDVSYLKQDGTFLVDRWFESGSMFRGNISIVRIDSDDGNSVKSNFLDKNGNILYPNQWFKRIKVNKIGLSQKEEYDNAYKVYLGDKWYYANKDGVINFDKPFNNN